MEKDYPGMKVLNFSKAGWKENLMASFASSYYGGASAATARMFMTQALMSK